MRNKQKVIGISVALIVIVLAVFAVYGMVDKSEPVSEETAETEESFATITYKGKTYKYNTDLKTILFMGIDNREEVSAQEYSGRGGQSDVLLLLVLDTARESMEMLQISRDSMVEVDVFDMDGQQIAEETAQIALQYAYGDGAKKSCLLTKDKVSELLYDIPVQSYVSLNIDGIAAITDAIGGIKLTVPEDYTMIDPVFEKGKEVMLTGALAEKYIRYRDMTVTGSNNDRMARQSQVLEAVIKQLPEKAENDESFYKQLFSAAEPYMVTDISQSEAEKLMSYQAAGEPKKVPGEVSAGEEHDEFHVNDEELYDLLVKMFYKEI